MMKKFTLIIAVLVTVSLSAQTKSHRFGISAGGSIHHYNGNLGNSFFQYKTTCFAGGVLDFAYYANKSIDVKFSCTLGDFGYCQTEADASKIVPVEIRCPGCAGRKGMGDLRSRMLAGNLAVVYKFSNGYLLNENSILSPYLYAGAGVSYLSDVMKKNCVNIGYHFSVNGGLGVKCRINERAFFGYNAGISCFTGKKVYASSAESYSGTEHNAEVKQWEKRKDMLMQNTLFIGFNL